MTISLDRRSTRLAGFDYSAEATYFVTICTYQRTHLFGKVDGDEMICSPFGVSVLAAWEQTITLRRELVPHGFVVMPNHVHALFSLDPSSAPVELNRSSGESADALQSVTTVGSLRHRHSVPTIVGGFKGDATRRIRAISNAPGIRIWQERYHDRIVRDAQEFETILRYIETNPQRWAEDRYSTSH